MDTPVLSVITPSLYSVQSCGLRAVDDELNGGKTKKRPERVG